MPLPKIQERYTYQDYLTWDEEKRWELIEGVPYDMTPAPSFQHQRVVGNFYHLLRNALQGSTCIPGIAPVDVVLSEQDVVQPDVFVVCDPQVITPTIIQGAPDLVVEVLSPSTSKKDKREKKKLYEKYGVKEYILIDIEGLYVERFFWESSGSYNKGEIFDHQELLNLSALPDLQIPLWEVFETKKPE